MTEHIGGIHKGKKPFKCEICDYRSSQKSSMNRHVSSVHEGNKPFKCDICAYSCSLKNTMKGRVASVHEVKMPFKCGICNYCFSLKQKMKQHVAKKHEGKKLWYICESFECSQVPKRLAWINLFYFINQTAHTSSQTRRDKDQIQKLKDPVFVSVISLS